MLFSQSRRLVLSLTLFLLSSAAFAEPIAKPALKSPQVQIKVDFVVTNTTDVDNLGINFDLIPLTSLTANQSANQKPAFLLFASGNMAAQLYQTLARTGGTVLHVPPVTTANNTAAVIHVDGLVPDGLQQTATTPDFGNFPTLKRVVQVQGEITLMAHTHEDGSVSLDLIPITVTGKPIRLRTIPSGAMLVFSNMVVGQYIPVLGGLFRTRNQMTNVQELLIFITPTILDRKAER